MTEHEYLQKRTDLQSSLARSEVKEKAIEALDNKFKSFHAVHKAINDIFEQAPDYDSDGFR